jgi:hypothetical protein
MSVVERLSESDLKRFASDGYLVVPDVVGDSLLDAADVEIDQITTELPPDQGDRGPGANLWFPPVARLPRCDEMLRRSQALSIAGELVSPLVLGHAFDHIQIATTVPGWPHKPGGPHSLLRVTRGPRRRPRVEMSSRNGPRVIA